MAIIQRCVSGAIAPPICDAGFCRARRVDVAAHLFAIEGTLAPTCARRRCEFRALGGIEVGLDFIVVKLGRLRALRVVHGIDGLPAIWAVGPPGRRCSQPAAPYTRTVPILPGLLVAGVLALLATVAARRPPLVGAPVLADPRRHRAASAGRFGCRAALNAGFAFAGKVRAAVGDRGLGFRLSLAVVVHTGWGGCQILRSERSR